MPKVTINGKEVDVPEGLNLVQAAELIGEEIPHYCYHPGLTVVGNCRMCLVEVEKAPKLAIACNTKAAEGMVVHTNNQRVKTAQAAVLEFLLINHPIDCPVCDQAGECKLQDYYMDYDRRPSQFELERKVHKGKAIDVGSGVMLDQERCILCARCTRFFDEVTHTGELSIFERGDHCKIDTFPDRKIDNKYAGNVIDICPVGALTEKDFRFRMRVWYLHRTLSVCGACERGCSIDVDHNQGKIYRFKPRFNPNVNGYWMCDEGRHSFPALQTERRLGHPMVQEGDRLVAEPYAEAIRRAVTKIQEIGEEHGAQAVGALVGAQATNEEIFALKRFVTELIGSSRIGGMSFTPPGLSETDNLLIRANKNPNSRGLEALGVGQDGLDKLGAAVEAGQLKLLIALRADAARAMGEAEFMKRFGPLDYLIVLDTDATETARMANQVLPIAAYTELDGTFTNFQGWVQRLRRAVPAPVEVITTLELIARLSQALDGDERPHHGEVVFKEMADSESAFKGLSYETLGVHGAPLNA